MTLWDLILIYAVGFLILWVGFSYKIGCRERAWKNAGEVRYSMRIYRTDWYTARAVMSFGWPIAVPSFMLGSVVYRVGRYILWPIVTKPTSFFERLGERKGCPKITMD